MDDFAYGAFLVGEILKFKVIFSITSIILFVSILSASKGRIWYSFSNTPVNYDPGVTRLYKDGKVKSGWY
ncbi:hypothetical protein [Paenibacillus sp. LPE1-1-1.1]|uniref:hypothetical protein n=1 Tax=Paenibacillus sp. LPE1-1-1.1 TaxID=3135230 RepID=UPI00341E9503